MVLKIPIGHEMLIRRSSPSVFMAILTSLAMLLSTTRAHAEDRPEAPAEVVVLSSLHQYQSRVHGYGYADLARIVELLRPDVFALELSAEDITERRPQRAKQEYPQSIFPLLDRRSYITVPLEPSDPLRSELGDRLFKSEQDFAVEAPERAHAFDVYTEQLFLYLFDRWRSPCDVNSSETDALLEVKHRFQDAIYPSEQAVAWDAWNQHFLSQLKQAARSYPAKRIVALVGAEHAYWLREHLSVQPELRLLDTESLLRDEVRVCDSAQPGRKIH